MSVFPYECYQLIVSRKLMSILVEDITSYPKKTVSPSLVSVRLSLSDCHLFMLQLYHEMFEMGEFVSSPKIAPGTDGFFFISTRDGGSPIRYVRVRYSGSLYTILIAGAACRLNLDYPDDPELIELAEEQGKLDKPFVVPWGMKYQGGWFNLSDSDDEVQFDIRLPFKEMVRYFLDNGLGKYYENVLTVRYQKTGICKYRSIHDLDENNLFQFFEDIGMKNKTHQRIFKANMKYVTSKFYKVPDADHVLLPPGALFYDPLILLNPLTNKYEGEPFTIDPKTGKRFVPKHLMYYPHGVGGVIGGDYKMGKFNKSKANVLQATHQKVFEKGVVTRLQSNTEDYEFMEEIEEQRRSW